MRLYCGAHTWAITPSPPVYTLYMSSHEAPSNNERIKPCVWHHVTMHCHEENVCTYVSVAIHVCVSVPPPPPPQRLTPSPSPHHQLSPLIYILCAPTNGISHKFPEVRQHERKHTKTYRHKCVRSMCTLVCVLGIGWEGQPEDTRLQLSPKLLSHNNEIVKKW